MRRQFAQITSTDGRFAANFLLNDDGKAGVRLRLPRGSGLSDYKGIGLPQAIGIIEVLSSALREAVAYRQARRSDRYVAKQLAKTRATNGRATALIRVSSEDRLIISLGIAKTGTRFDHVELQLGEAGAVIEVLSAVLRQAEAQRSAEGSS